MSGYGGMPACLSLRDNRSALSFPWPREADSTRFTLGRREASTGGFTCELGGVEDGGEMMEQHRGLEKGLQL